MSCPQCSDLDGLPCLPQYGLAPHPEAADGQSAFQPRELWPENFQEDPQNPNHGTWWCAHCGDGKPDNQVALQGSVERPDWGKAGFKVFGNKMISQDEIDAFRLGYRAKQAEPTDEVAPLKIYRHYKGGLYKLIAEANLESDSSKTMTVYQGADGRIWTRPSVEFFELVEFNGEKMPRFSPLVQE